MNEYDFERLLWLATYVIILPSQETNASDVANDAVMAYRNAAVFNQPVPTEYDEENDLPF